VRDDIDVRLIDYWLQADNGEGEKRREKISEGESSANDLFFMGEKPYEKELKNNEG